MCTASRSVAESAARIRTPRSGLSRATQRRGGRREHRWCARASGGHLLQRPPRCERSYRSARSGRLPWLSRSARPTPADPVPRSAVELGSAVGVHHQPLPQRLRDPAGCVQAGSRLAFEIGRTATSCRHAQEAWISRTAVLGQAVSSERRQPRSHSQNSACQLHLRRIRVRQLWIRSRAPAPRSRPGLETTLGRPRTRAALVAIATSRRRPHSSNTKGIRAPMDWLG
jgi:hypothetical protein